METHRSNVMLVIVAWAQCGAVLAADAPVDFVRDVRPILEKHCHACHGEMKQKSGLRLDVKQAAFQGGDAYGPALAPHKSADSPLVRLITSADKNERMPPEGDGMSAAEVDLIRRWVDQGASWPDGVDRARLADKRNHWSFKPPVVSAGADGIDEFVVAKLQEHRLAMAPEAEPLVWLRRVTFDLIGLPPTPDEVADFQRALDLARSSSSGESIAGETAAQQAIYAAVVERLLASERYGERQAQHWLDVVRYADTHGFEVNTERPNAWPYRDYVIRAFNRDTPYDRFVREQIVGDALGEDAATGFLVTASVLLPGQIGKDEPSQRLARQDSLDEIVSNVGQTFLALSVGCARCHDHKFDPISARDYYALQAFVAGVAYGERDLRTPEAIAARREAEAARGRTAEIERQLARLAPDETAQATALMRERESLDAVVKANEQRAKVFAGAFRMPDEIRLLARGDPEQPKELVVPAVLRALGDVTLAASTPEQERRRALADWIASPRNPLTARVMVNRIWQTHFGAGLVRTPSDFGRSGLQPTHPELLDWLAIEFVRDGWSVKRMHRRIVLSRTYRQSSAARPDAAEKDAEVRYLWRYPSRRLEAEAIRDAMLAVGGRLNFAMYGRGFDLFDKRGGLSGFRPVESLTAANQRRMIYAHKVRREPEAVFGAFDCPDAGQSTAVRRASTTPIQALNLFNSRFTLDLAAAFAERVKNEAGDDLGRQIDRAHLIAFHRTATRAEHDDAEPVVREHGLAVVCRAILNSNEFLFIP